MQVLHLHCELDASYAGYLSDTAPEQLQQLFDALIQEQAGDLVQYRDLFLEDNDLNQASRCIIVSPGVLPSLCFDSCKMSMHTLLLTSHNTLFGFVPQAVCEKSTLVDIC